MSKLIITVAERQQGFATSLLMDGNGNEWALSQKKTNHVKALNIANSDDVYTGEETIHFYQQQLDKYLAKFDDFKNIEIKKL